VNHDIRPVRWLVFELVWAGWCWFIVRDICSFKGKRLAKIWLMLMLLRCERKIILPSLKE